MRNRSNWKRQVTALLLGFGGAVNADELPLVDAHIHYSQDAWQVLSPEKAVELLHAAGLKKALVSSSSDEGTQKLYRIAYSKPIPMHWCCGRMRASNHPK